MLKQIVKFAIGVGFMYGGFMYSSLAYTLLSQGQFFTPILAGCVGTIGFLFAILFIMESVD